MSEIEKKEWYIAIIEFNYDLCLYTATSGETFHWYSDRIIQNRQGRVIAERFDYCPKLFEKLNGYNGDRKFTGNIPLLELIKEFSRGTIDNAQEALDNLCLELMQAG